MRVFNLTEQNTKIPMSLPVYHEDASCIAMMNKIYCNSPYMDATFYSEDNKRIAVSIKVRSLPTM